MLVRLCVPLFPQACKYAMRVCAPVVGSEQISTMFLNHLHEDKGLHYGEFINDLTKYLVRKSQSFIIITAQCLIIQDNSACL